MNNIEPMDEAAANHRADRREVLSRLGGDAEPIVRWLDAAADAGAVYRSILETESSVARLQLAAHRAPAFISRFEQDPSLTRAIILGDFRNLETSAEFDSKRDRLAAQWALDPTLRLGERLSELVDDTVLQLAGDANLKADIVALGSLAAQESSFGSDAELLLLVERDEIDQEAAERFADRVRGLEPNSSDLGINIHLHPSGRKGRLVRSYDALLAYAEMEMDNREWFALFRYRIIRGSNAIVVLDRVLRSKPWSRAALDDLLAVKHRIESDQVAPHLCRRHVRLGEGGLGDIEWLTQLLVMSQFPSMPVPPARTEDRIRALQSRSQLNAIEAEELLVASTHLLDIRHHLRLLGFEADIIPENPEKQDHLAASLGMANGYELMRKHEEIRSTVRIIFEDTVARLQG